MRILLAVSLPLLFIATSTSCVQEPDELLARGTYLVEGILACGNCHTPKSADAMPIAEMIHNRGAGPKSLCPEYHDGR